MSNNIRKENFLNREQLTGCEVPAASFAGINKTHWKRRWQQHFQYVVPGIWLGFVLIKSGAISWFRMQEMFRLQSFYLYGTLGTAIVVGMASVWVIKRFNIKTINGSPITFSKKIFSKGQMYGGLLFGFGWALAGACPGTLFAQVGTGALAVMIVLISALAGTWVYGYISEKLPH